LAELHEDLVDERVNSGADSRLTVVLARAARVGATWHVRRGGLTIRQVGMGIGTGLLSCSWILSHSRDSRLTTIIDGLVRSGQYLKLDP
jgi:hypothetical protein